MARAATKRAFDAGLEAAITAYKSSVKRGEYGQGPFAVASGIRENVYKEIRSREEDPWRLSYNKSTSQVFLYGDPSRAHERASRWFDAKIGAYAIENGLEDELAQSGAATVDLPGVIKEPDFSLLLARDHHCPALVAEVACHNESMAALRRSLHDWTCPGFAAMALGSRAEKVFQELLELPESQAQSIRCYGRCLCEGRVDGRGGEIPQGQGDRFWCYEPLVAGYLLKGDAKNVKKRPTKLEYKSVMGLLAALALRRDVDEAEKVMGHYSSLFGEAPVYNQLLKVYIAAGKTPKELKERMLERLLSLWPATLSISTCKSQQYFRSQSSRCYFAGSNDALEPRTVSEALTVQDEREFKGEEPNENAEQEKVVSLCRILNAKADTSEVGKNWIDNGNVMSRDVAAGWILHCRHNVQALKFMNVVREERLVEMTSKLYMQEISQLCLQLEPSKGEALFRSMPESLRTEEHDKLRDTYYRFKQKGLKPVLFMYWQCRERKRKMVDRMWTLLKSEQVVAPDLNSYISAIKSFGLFGDLEKAYEVLEEVLQKFERIPQNPYIWIVEICVRLKMMDQAEKLMEKHIGKSCFLPYNFLVSGYVETSQI
ncbi:hypothetical protein SELMODRAFT_412151 [Selaginella moellendorffii]|uniref:Pentacotripeptide-repeat region of PRORP domain-containing protein n=1 Tax=Selaginella moellendorffii TaxID=88036 RepID=D8RK81_SELML|nr:hypothetical protein SELMODRAFT_412151 [Selaginella moellendorffii]